MTDRINKDRPVIIRRVPKGVDDKTVIGKSVDVLQVLHTSLLDVAVLAHIGRADNGTAESIAFQTQAHSAGVILVKNGNDGELVVRTRDGISGNFHIAIRRRSAIIAMNGINTIINDVIADCTICSGKIITVKLDCLQKTGNRTAGDHKGRAIKKECIAAAAARQRTVFYRRGKGSAADISVVDTDRGGKTVHLTRTGLNCKVFQCNVCSAQRDTAAVVTRSPEGFIFFLQDAHNCTFAGFAHDGDILRAQRHIKTVVCTGLDRHAPLCTVIGACCRLDCGNVIDCLLDSRICFALRKLRVRIHDKLDRGSFQCRCRQRHQCQKQAQQQQRQPSQVSFHSCLFLSVCNMYLGFSYLSWFPNNYAAFFVRLCYCSNPSHLYVNCVRIIPFISNFANMEYGCIPGYR